MVLGTDMSKHFSNLGRFKGQFEREEEAGFTHHDKEHVLEVSLHLSDISNPVKPWKLCEK